MAQHDVLAGRDEALVQADALAAEGRLVEAVDLLAAANAEHRDPMREIRLVDLRLAAAAALPGGGGRPDWPPRYDDPFPGLFGVPAEVAAGDLTTEVMGGAVAHHGALVVRGLFDADRVARTISSIRAAEAGRLSHAGDAEVDAAYRPVATGRGIDQTLRAMVAKQGGTWLADSPLATAQVLGDLAGTGVVAAIAEHFGERPFFSLQKSTLRRSAPVLNITAWHQDGSFLTRGVRTMNVWVALTACGGDHKAPGLEIVPKRIDDIIEPDGVLTKHAVSFEDVERVSADTPTLCPEFAPGDAMVFDERFLHRTHLFEGMTEDRYALECWFFAPSHQAQDYLPLLA